MKANTWAPVATRIWAARRLDDGTVIAHVEDIAATNAAVRAWLDQYDAGTTLRWWCISAYDEDEDPNEDTGPHGKACAPGRPCGHCHERAAAWWPEWERRREERRQAEAQPGLFEVARG